MADAQIPQIDISNYVDQKAAGNASIIKIDGACHLRIAAEKPAPLLLPLSADSLTEAIAQKEADITKIQGEIDTLNVMLKDINSATELGA